MAATKTRAKRALQTRRAEKKEKVDMIDKWQGACVPPDIRQPWDVFHEHILYEDNDLAGETLLARQKDLHAVQELGALQAFQELPACRQRMYTEVSLQELAAFATWNATSSIADAMERYAVWTSLDDDLKADHVPRNWRAQLARDPRRHILIADGMKEEVEEHHERERKGEEPPLTSLNARRWQRLKKEPAEHNADEKKNSFLAENGAMMLRVDPMGRVVIATRTPGDPKNTPEGVEDDKKLHEPAGRIPASPAYNHAASGVRPAAGTSAPVARNPIATKGKSRRTPGQRRVDALEAKYPWGREGGPPPASEAERQSLANEMASLRKQRHNFARPERADGERLARADAMLQNMRSKAYTSFGGGQAMATHGLSWKGSAGLKLARRARKLELDLKAVIDPKAAHRVLIEEGIALLDAD